MEDTKIKNEYKIVVAFSTVILICTATSCYLALSEVARLGGGL